MDGVERMGAIATLPARRMVLVTTLRTGCGLPAILISLAVDARSDHSLSL